MPDCNDICRRVHGHDREVEVRGAIERGTARVVLLGDHIAGYSTEISFLAHAVALDNPGLMALIAAAEQFTGPGFLLPSRNSEIFRWCLSKGLRVTQPMSLMTMGLYNEPRGAWLPSVLY